MKYGKMQATTLLLSSAMVTGISGLRADEVIDLGDVEIIKTTVDDKTLTSSPIYESYDPVDSGASVIGEETIKNSAPGGIDTTDLLKTLPFVQMDNSLDDATQENIQSIRPKDFSISGGNFYDNNIQIDGVSATSVHDVTGTSGDLDWNNVSGQTSQTLYVDPDLIGAVKVYDSNVSAEHGNFIGGVVNYELRKPRKEFGVNISTSIQNDSLVRYHEPRKIDDDTEEPATFDKYKTSISVDLPINEKLSLLTSYSRTQSSVQYVENIEYGGHSHDNGDISENFLLKSVYDYREDLTFEGQLIYSPYESERDLPNARDDLTISESTGLQGYLAASGFFGDTDWNSKIAMMHNDSSRESGNVRYKWDGDYLDWCNTTRNCFEGGIGDLEQTQTDFTWTTSFATALDDGTLSYGSEFKQIVAEKSRPEGSRYYLNYKANNSGYDCVPGDPTCKPNMASSQYYDYKAFDAKVGVYSHALWSEYLTQLGPVEVRGGARYSYDDFLKNHNVAPRFTASWEFKEETFLSVGANRYFGGNMVGYAIREKTPAHECYERTLTGGEAPGDWVSCKRQPISTNYSSSDLKTPYSDELTAAITIPTGLNGNLRLKTVHRKNHDQFAKSDKLTDANGKDYYQMTNDGKTDYLGYSIEWSGNYDKHFFNANVTWSETKNNGLVDYHANSEDETEYVYYNGQIMTLADMYEHDARQNFAAPLRASISWSTSWLEEKLVTHASLYYRSTYEFLDDTGENYTDTDGKRYDIYAKEESGSMTGVDLNAKYRLFERNGHAATVDVRVKNLFDKVNRSDTNYQMGRSFWVGLNYSY